MRKSYPSDITREQFEVIRPILDRAKKTTHPRKYDLYDIFCAVLYLIKEGCTWRGIPHDFPKWENVRYHYDIWAKPDENGFSLLDGILRDLVEIERETDNREAQTTMLIIDSKTSQNADTAKTNGYDAGKKTGIKWHVGVDTLGLPHVIALTAADVTDRDGAVWMIARFCEATKESLDRRRIYRRKVNGGTNFETPMRKAMSLIEEDGFEKADVVFITDGECELNETYARELYEKQTAPGFTVTGILLDADSPGMEFSLRNFCQNI